DLKREFARLSEMMSRYSEHAARPNGERPVEGEQKASVAVSVERNGSFAESLRSGGTGHESSQGNNDSNIGFNQFRQGQQFTRAGAAPDNMARMQNFNDQLQSMLNNSRLVVKDGKNGHFTMQLFPESMGRVNVRLGLEDGIIHGRFLVDSHEARDQMLENLGALRQKMAEAGIEVGEFQVNVRQQQEQFAGKNREEDSDAPGAGVQLDPGQQYELGAVVRHDGSFDMTA
ncbi:MAG TPA: flagellar hook-length control protein FliK, partial [Spirochaetota bacterium]|nr:flagellar hook-length control protein FliK [Spirochaetota bacterium]